jgi:ribosome biogenesis GTPase / thiamine phosphate phosphatase
VIAQSTQARIAIDDGVAYVAWIDGARVTLRLSGKMRRGIRTGSVPRPVVGDFVSVTGDGQVEELLPRRTRLARKAAGRSDVEQVIAANVDIGFVATAAGIDLNERRLERYLAVVRDGGVQPVFLLTKVDASADAESDLARVQSVAGDVDVIAVSATTGQGVEEVARRIAPDRTAALLGSSGVGKSTLFNRLVGESRQRVGALLDDGTGRHTTTRRELFPLPTGGWLVDTPGMREVGLLDADEGVTEAFPDLEALAESCRFRDCAHTAEPGCAVRAAIADGAMGADRLEAWSRLQREVAARRARRR